MTSFRERNEARGPARGARRGFRPRSAGKDPAGFVWGAHAVEAALRNPRRTEIAGVLSTPEKAERLRTLRPELPLEILSAAELGRRLPAGAAHQGAALEAPPLAGVGLDEVARPSEGVLLMLDQITDPMNVGAIFRSAAAMGARGVILQDRHAPLLGGALAKAAAGAIDQISAVRAVNLARTLDRLADEGWTVVGLSGSGEALIGEAFDPRPTVLVLGSEGEGMRRLVAEHCDLIARIPMPGGAQSLNVAAAAAIALYEAQRQRPERAWGEGS